MKPTLRSRLNRWLDPENSGQLQELARLIFAALFGTDHATEQIAKARFIAHYEEVRSLVPQERLLEFNVKDGWVPLATFLSKDVPEVAFPRVNDTEQFKKVVLPMLHRLVWGATMIIGASLVVVVALTIYIVKTRVL
jgi:hypothetical protein